MGAGIVTIQAYLALADALWGSKFVQAIINGLHAGGHLTDAEKAQLEANHADYQARIAAREAEKGGA